jgi:predicted lysophospholipase L1 biosynthesis ABC-type transport system permease subunit
MITQTEHLDDLKEIRTIMERSSRFISLSGLTGVFAGTLALLGALSVYLYKQDYFLGRYFSRGVFESSQVLSTLELRNLVVFLLSTACIVLFLSLGFGILFTTRNARRKGLPIWDSTVKRMLINLFIPLAAGGIFCLALLYHHQIYLVAPATLVFYGLALINTSKYTLNDIRYLGIAEVILGLTSMFFAGYSLIFWAVGFGIIHIVYGTTMYWKNERINR